MKLLALIAVVVLWQNPDTAQTPLRADFSGTWTLTPDSAVGSSPVGTVFEISQTVKTLTLKGRDGARNYELDGSETTWQTTTVRGDAWRKSARLRIVTNAVVITTHTEAGSTGAWDDLILLSLDSRGRLTLVSSSALLNPKPIMGTHLFVYEKKPEK